MACFTDISCKMFSVVIRDDGLMNLSECHFFHIYSVTEDLISDESNSIHTFYKKSKLQNM